MWHNIPMGAGKRFSADLRPGGDAGPILIAAQAAVDAFVDEERLDPRAAARLSVVIEEILANALHHGRAGQVSFGLKAETGRIAIALEDDGEAFDPTADRTFDGPDEDTGGGVGLALLRSWGEALDYTRDGGVNRLSLRLKLDR